jgi:YfiH family protein
MNQEPLTHPLLAACGVRHGFGRRQTPPPPKIIRPIQVHGRVVAQIGPKGEAQPSEADAIIAAASHSPGATLGVVTADCVPILLATPGGAWVAAIHAGWRGLAQGVIEATCQRLTSEGVSLGEACCVIGPHIGACCYEVDAPVLDAMVEAFGDRARVAFVETRPGHWKVELKRLVAEALQNAGVKSAHMGELPESCTCCDAEAFHSYRRDGATSGRLMHFIQASDG